MRKFFRSNHQRAAYQRGVALVLEAHEILGGVKTLGWTQAVVLNEVFLRLEQAAESLSEAAPNDLSSLTRQRIARGWHER